MAYTIRRYSLADIPTIIEFIKSSFNEHRGGQEGNAYKGISVCAAKLRTLLEAGINDISFFGDVVEDENGQIVGAFAAQVQTYVFSQERLAVDLFLNVKHGHGNLRLLREMVKRYVRWASRLGVREALLTTSTGYKPKKFGALAVRAGFGLVEHGYSRRV